MPQKQLGPTCQQFTLTTASADISSANWKKIECAFGEEPAGGSGLGAQALGFRALSSATGAAATIQVAFVRSDGVGPGQGVQEVWTGTVTASARRQELANTGGAGSGYVCDIVFDKSQTYYVDGAGLGGWGAAADADPLVPYVGITAAGGLGTLELEVWATRNAG